MQKTFNLSPQELIENQKDLYIATLAHDLKNPLLAQISSLKLLNTGAFGEINESQHEMLNMILESANYMQEMLFSIVRTYKELNGAIQLKKSLFNIENLIENSVRETKNLAGEKKLSIALNCYLEDTDKYIEADRTQIRRVIDNLLNNAVKYTKNDTAIKILIQKIENNFIFSITNKSEYPISKELEKNIFKKYVCGKKYSKSIGTGLGLYYCQKIIEGHGGTINLTANNDTVTFQFIIPQLSKHSKYISFITL